MALNENEIEKIVRATNERAAASAIHQVAATQETPSGLTRNILVIGCGDGGCNIASDIKKAYPEVAAIAYNTSRRGVDSLKVDRFLIPEAEDGSGKERSYSKHVFRSGVFRKVLEAVYQYGDNADYILVTTTCDGGTGGGISPMIASLLMKNLGIPVIVIGVYPSLSEDGRAQHNMLEWQKEVEEVGARYMIFDNNAYADLPKMQIHQKINQDIVKIVGVLLGKDFGKTNIQAIDSRDMEMILNRYSGRITITVSNNRPRVGKSIGQMCVQEAREMSQPVPNNAQSYGLMIKGSQNFLNSVDTSAVDIREEFGEGDMYTHLQVSDDLEIALICGGCTAPETRIQLAAQRYNEIMSERNEKRTVMDDIMAGLVDEGEGSYSRNQRVSLDDIDLSALDL